MPGRIEDLFIYEMHQQRERSYETEKPSMGLEMKRQRQ